MTESVKRGLSGSTLKMIAVVTMFIDHVGAAILARMIRGYRQLSQVVTWDGLWKYFPWILDGDRLIEVYRIMRSIGRIAFPIYCFLLVEGFIKTRSRLKYAVRLGVFALISEVPFDLAFNGRPFDFSYQNVFFTLFLGLITMTVLDNFWQRRWVKAAVPDRLIRYGLMLLAILAGCAAARLVRCDYGAKGILCILVLYLFRNCKILKLVGGAVSFCWEMPAPLAFVPIACYNGRRGLRIKYFFYAFYPLHLFLIYMICVWLGIEGFPAL